jgi:beta-lactamase regulating signal transducer with metallopeptidase domain
MIYHHETNFRQLRIFLMGSVLLSLLIPFNPYTIDLVPDNTPVITQQESVTLILPADPAETGQSIHVLNWQRIARKIYFLFVIILVSRIVVQLITLALQYLKAEKIRQNGYVILLHHRFRDTFSFFKWIFIHRDASSQEDLQPIIAHEKIHVSQYHSLDLIVVELLTAVMWFNPLIWMMRNSVQLVHEYLADEGALNTGIDRLRYQALLINQVTEERLVGLSSSFNHSLIKKRMKMITHYDVKHRSRMKIMTLLPLSITLFFTAAIGNSFFPERIKAEPATPELNYLSYSNLLPLSNSNLPQDTIKKKTITKVVRSDNPNDTVITETMEILLSDDPSKEVWIHEEGREEKMIHGKKLIFISEDGDVQHIEKKPGDTIRYVKVIKLTDESDVDHEEDIDITTDKGEHVVVIRKSPGVNWTSSDDPDNTLIIIDGEKQKDKHAWAMIDPDDIESISVIRDKKMMKAYTEEDYEGVIVITKKKGTR